MKIELHVHGFEVKFKAELAGELMLRTQSNNLRVIPSSPPSRRSELGCGSSETYQLLSDICCFYPLRCCSRGRVAAKAQVQ